MQIKYDYSIYKTNSNKIIFSAKSMYFKNNKNFQILLNYVF